MHGANIANVYYGTQHWRAVPITTTFFASNLKVIVPVCNVVKTLPSIAWHKHCRQLAYRHSKVNERSTEWMIRNTWVNECIRTCNRACGHRWASQRGLIEWMSAWMNSGALASGMMAHGPEWMTGDVNEWAPAWLIAWVNEWMGDDWLREYLNEAVDESMSAWLPGLVSDWLGDTAVGANTLSKQPSEGMSEWVSAWVREWVSAWVTDWVTEWNKWMNDWVREWVNDPASEWMSERLPGWVNAWVGERVCELIHPIRCVPGKLLPAYHLSMPAKILKHPVRSVSRANTGKRCLGTNTTLSRPIVLLVT